MQTLNLSSTKPQKYAYTGESSYFDVILLMNFVPGLDTTPVFYTCACVSTGVTSTWMIPDALWSLQGSTTTTQLNHQDIGISYIRMLSHDTMLTPLASNN